MSFISGCKKNVFNIWYYFKSNSLRYFSFAFTFVFLLIASYFYIPSIIEGRTNYKLYTSANVNEVWFTEMPITKDCFINLNGKKFLYYNDKSISVDIFMQLNEVEYENNLFNLKKNLNEDECVISKNIAYEYNIKIGDYIYSSDGVIGFKVVSFFASQNGVDDKYLHSGIAVLGENVNFIPKTSVEYACFLKDGNGLFNVNRIVFLNSKIRLYKHNYENNLLSLFIAFVAICAINEIVIFRKKIYDYRLIYSEGISKIKMLCSVLSDSFIKYIVPVLLVLLFNMKYNFLFQSGYLFLVTNLFAIGLLLLFITTIFYCVRSGYHGKIK